MFNFTLSTSLTDKTGKEECGEVRVGGISRNSPMTRGCGMRREREVRD